MAFLQPMTESIERGTAIDGFRLEKKISSWSSSI
jgi:hypothetical protein